MNRAEQYFRMFESGATYAQIAERYGVNRNTVAARIYEHRKENGLSPNYRNMPKKLVEKTRQRKTQSNGVYKFDAAQEDARKEKLKECVKREDGVTICPPGYALGYGYERGGA